MADNTQLIAEAVRRGVENIYPTPVALEQLLVSGKKIKLYNGIDPTGRLQVGHSVVLNKLRQFQDLGHQVIVLIGDFTAMVGDPTDKMAARKMLSRKEVIANTKNYKKQIGKILDLKKTTFKFNSRWLAKMSFTELLTLSSYFTAQQTLARDMFKKRISEGKDLYLNEFLYPVMQAYDSVVLDVDLEVGGNDQTFNMLAGRTLMKKMKQKEKFVLTMKLLADPSGRKMGKTEGNAIFLDEPADGMYGKVMSWTDGMIVPAFELVTRMPMAEIEQIASELKDGANPKRFKMLLAYKIVELYHGNQAAIKAEENFKQVFEEGLNPDDILAVKIKERNIVDVLIASKLVTSRSEARRLIAQGGIKVDQKTVIDEKFEIGPIDRDGVIIQKGKRHFVKII